MGNPPFFQRVCDMILAFVRVEEGSRKRSVGKGRDMRRPGREKRLGLLAEKREWATIRRLRIGREYDLVDLARVAGQR